MTDLELSLLRNRVLMVVQEEDRKRTEHQLFLRARVRLITPGCDQRLLHFLIWEEIDMLDVPTSVRHDIIIFELQHREEVA